jgi:hypothetical protein
MLLTDAQYTTLATDITVTNAAEFAAALAATDDQAIAAAYNLLASPSYWVWRTRVTAQEIYETVTADGTSWSWTIYIARSVGERDAWRELTSVTGFINPSLPNTRQGVADIFSGAGGAAQRTHLLAIGRRPSRRIEKLSASGAGSTAAPSVMGAEGELTYRDVAHAVRGVPL